MEALQIHPIRLHPTSPSDHSRFFFFSFANDLYFGHVAALLFGLSFDHHIVVLPVAHGLHSHLHTHRQLCFVQTRI